MARWRVRSWGTQSPSCGNAALLRVANALYVRCKTSMSCLYKNFTAPAAAFGLEGGIRFIREFDMISREQRRCGAPNKIDKVAIILLEAAKKQAS